ncbi:hypothetical protein PR202_ga27294 [Eleusine coracana subsp. coracana]|uniref:Uncharacterized protein n=1 Tax=Eleusine coracana subsp. coracana TaxID=191504 RepID=A0AAV5DEF0_ELECO|nr:hypothetical protein PR202_ga27294 [Eleusine coracana subsp. coracana]
MEATKADLGGPDAGSTGHDPSSVSAARGSFGGPRPCRPTAPPLSTKPRKRTFITPPARPTVPPPPRPMVSPPPRLKAPPPPRHGGDLHLQLLSGVSLRRPVIPGIAPQVD